MKTIIHITYILLLVMLFSSCSEWDSNGADFRNYLRDKHPYSILRKIELNGEFDYEVLDTINKEIWIYSTYIDKSSVKRVKI